MYSTLCQHKTQVASGQIPSGVLISFWKFLSTDFTTASTWHSALPSSKHKWAFISYFHYSRAPWNHWIVQIVSTGKSQRIQDHVIWNHSNDSVPVPDRIHCCDSISNRTIWGRFLYQFQRPWKKGGEDRAVQLMATISRKEKIWVSWFSPIFYCIWAPSLRESTTHIRGGFPHFV